MSRTMVEEQLKFVLQFVDSHVRFGEAKNAAAFVAAGGLSIAAATLLFSEQALPIFVVAYLMLAWSLGMAAAVISLASFLPRTQLPWLGELAPPNTTDNLLFFGHVQKYNAESYWRAMANLTDATQMSRMEFCISEQIVINARIASRKFTLFKYAAWTLLAAFITPPAALGVYFYIRGPET